MTLPFMPMKKNANVSHASDADPAMNLETRLRTLEENYDKLYSYVQDLVDDFPNAAGEAIDPTEGQGGDGALEITDIPTNITYTPGSGLSFDEVLFGHIDISFTLPARAVGVIIKYREAAVTNFDVTGTSTSPYRLTSLKVGTTYNLQLAGEAANGAVGPYSPLATVTISTTAAIVKAPADAAYIVAALDDTLSAERVATDTPTISWDFATTGQAKANLVETYQLLSQKDAVSGYAGLNSVSRVTKGIDTTDDLIVDTHLKGLVIKEVTTGKYWRLTMVAGVLTPVDLGTTKP